MDSMAGMANPVMQQGQCVANCAVDSFFTNFRKSRKNDFGKGDGEYLFSNSGDNDSYSVVMPREFALRLPMKADSAIGRSNVMSSPTLIPKVFTSLNNFPASCTKDPVLLKALVRALESRDAHMINEPGHDHVRHLKRFVREMVCRSMIFVGVPLTRVDPTQNMASNISVAVAGTITVYNTGDDTIEAGQKIAWDVPDLFNPEPKRIRGEPRGKHFIEITSVPENGLEIAHSDKFMDPYAVILAFNRLDALRDTFGVSKALFKDSTIYKQYFQFFDTQAPPDMSHYMFQSAIHMTMGIHSRIIGTALTTSTKGTAVDILLQV